VLIHTPLLEALAAEFDDLSSGAVQPVALAAGAGIDLVLLVLPRKSVRQAMPTTQDLLAYILYTSGSTGKPKGVMHSHRTALSFVDWCSEELAPTAEDVFSSHAPFHFDLSIFDLYVSIKHQATLVLINEENGKQPLALSALIAEQGVSVWYSTPSILRLLLDYGKLEQHDLTALRLILYAGEVFPLKHLRSLTEALPFAQYYNLYGPTETNVCTYYKVSLPLPDDELLPQRIGFACSGDRTMVANDAGQRVAPGEEGELWVAGGSVHLGYWNLPDQNASAFHVDADGTRWYKTGDLVVEHASQGYVFRGRRDRMVKRRGYRVELGEIESVLYAHPCIAEVAVIAMPDASSGLRVIAFLQWTGDRPASTVELKRFASENLLSYMIPDRFVQLDTLPKTSTDKVDYQRLKEAAA
jgi:amino acid adenylation domain-containing protein